MPRKRSEAKRTPEEANDMAPPTKRVALTLTADYAKTWGTWEGLREVLQNWHDGLYEAKYVLKKELMKTTEETKETEMNYVKSRGDQEYDVYDAYLEYHEFVYKTDEYIKVRQKRENDTHLIGHVIYDKKEGRLSCINKRVQLQKNVLLLGYSNKPNDPQVIGQFGEGLKVGALALLRGGHDVALETKNELWRFELSYDGDFDQKLLTVQVTARKGKDKGAESAICRLPPGITLGDDDTIVTVAIDPEPWLNRYEQRFLFLRKPDRTVLTTLGHLLLDPEHQGQLHVKGVWVSDMRKEDLSSGVNFVDLGIDRDRNAVPKPSEIDHLVGSMWIKALEYRPDLSPVYYGLLKNDKFRDVRQAMVYADSKIAGLVAHQFEDEHGEDVIPISNTLTSSDIDRLKGNLDSNLVCVNDTLLRLLHMSGKHRPVEEELKLREKAPYEVVHMGDLDPDEKAVLDHAFKLTLMVWTDFTMSIIDVVEYLNPTTVGCVRKEKRILVPTWMIRKATAHTQGYCPTERDPYKMCVCRESRLATALIAVFNPTMHHVTGISQYEHHLLSLVRPLCVRECKGSEDCVRKAVEKQKKKAEENAVSHDECLATENELRETMASTKIEQDALVKSLREEVEGYANRLRDAEREITSGKIGSYHSEQKLRREFDEKFQAAHDSWRDKFTVLRNKAQEHESKYYEAEQRKHHLERETKDLMAELNRVRGREGRKDKSILDEMWHYVHMWQDSKKTLDEWVEKKLEDSKVPKEDVQSLNFMKKIAMEMKENLSRDTFYCGLCFKNRKDTLILPCGHLKYCEACLEKVKSSTNSYGCPQNGKCPFCRAEIQDTKKIYE